MPKRIAVILMIMFASYSVSGQDIRTIGLNGGVIIPDQDWKTGPAVEIQLEMGEIVKYVFLTPYIQYSQTAMDSDTLESSDQIDRRYIGLGAKLLGYLNPKPKGFFGGAAIGFTIITSDEYTVQPQSREEILMEQTDTRLALSVLAGYQLRFRNWGTIVEMKYSYIPGHYNTLRFVAGVNLAL